MNKVKVKIAALNLNHNEGLPKYETAGAAGMDLRSNEKKVIAPYSTALISTGIYVAVPDGYEIQVRPRSGMSLKTKIRIANSPGTVDSDYRGELCILCENIGGSAYQVSVGDRLAQIVLKEVPQIEWESVETPTDLPTTDRGTGGFGSTGKA